MRKVVLLSTMLAAGAALTGCGNSDEAVAKRDSEARAAIVQQRTVQGEPLAVCLERNGFAFDETYEGVQGTTQVIYESGEQEVITLNVDLAAGIVAPWDGRDDVVLKRYHCQPSDLSNLTPRATPSHSHG